MPLLLLLMHAGVWECVDARHVKYTIGAASAAGISGSAMTAVWGWLEASSARQGSQDGSKEKLVGLINAHRTSKNTTIRMQPSTKKASLGEATKEKMKQLWTNVTDTLKGGKKLYHCTSEQNAESIERSGFQPGSRGIAGGGMYFAETPADAARKAHSSGVVLKCRVKLGKVLDVGRSGDSSLNLSALREQGCNSVRIPRAGTEYCVYEPSRVRVVGRLNGHPLMHVQKRCGWCNAGDAGCFLCMGTGTVDSYEDAAARRTSSTYRH